MIDPRNSINRPVRRMVRGYARLPDSGAETTIYTCPPGIGVLVTSIIGFATASLVVTTHNVPSGGAAGATNVLMETNVDNAGFTFFGVDTLPVVPLPILLAPGDKISASTDTTGFANIWLVGEVVELGPEI